MCLLFFTPLFLRLVPVAAIGGLRPVELPFQILFLADLALPELLALIPADFDLDKGLLSITKSYQRLKGRDVITDPKTPKSYLHHEMDRGAKEAEVKRIRIHDLRHPYVKHTTKIFSLRLKFFQAQPVPDALRKTCGAFLHLREEGSHNPFLRSCNKKLSSWSTPQSKISLILYAISMRLSGYTSTLSMRRSVSSAVRPSELKTALAASCRLSCRACSSCFCFACANTTA